MFKDIGKWVGTVILAGVSGGLATAGIEALTKGRELDIRMVEIGLGILKVPVSEPNAQPAREWAIRVIERGSGVIFNQNDRTDLLKQRIVIGSSSGSLPAAPAFLQPAKVKEPEVGEPMLVVAARERAGRLANERVIEAMKEWYNSIDNSGRSPSSTPCGVIEDSLFGVSGATPADTRRIDIHFERGVGAGCWSRQQ